MDLALRPWHPNIAVRGRMARTARRASRIRGGICLIKWLKLTCLSSKPGCSVDALVCLSQWGASKVPKGHVGTSPPGPFLLSCRRKQGNHALPAALPDGNPLPTLTFLRVYCEAERPKI